MPSLRKCINDNCKDCIYDPTEKGSWRKQVEECTTYSCKLYPVRPVPLKKYAKKTVPVPGAEEGC